MRYSIVGSILCLLLACGCAATTSITSPNDSVNVTFLHLNDTYRIDSVEDGRRGGFGRIASLVRALQAGGKEVRILHGGDFLFPSLESQLWDGEQIVEAMNFLDELAPMYVVPGNHEFDSRSSDAIVARVPESSFDWIVDNMRLMTGVSAVDDSMRTGFTFSVGGKLIGVFGLTLHPEHGGNSRDYIEYDDGYVQKAEQIIEQFEADGADLIFGLTHLHLASDIEIAKLKRRHPTFEFIVGGHEHEVQRHSGDANTADVMKGASNARTIWQIDVTFSAGGTEVSSQQIDIDQSIAIDPEYQIIADRWRGKLLELVPFLASRIGYAATPLDGREASVRNGDSNWGGFIADQMRTAFRDPPADLAFINGGTLRIDDFVADDITFEDIGRTFGFSSYLRHMAMSGGEFRKTLEAGYRGTGEGKGYFPQISGFRVCVDRNRPDGQRIVQMQVPTAASAWQEIEPEHMYSVVVPDFLYRGGDGYDFTAAADVSRPGSELKFLVLDAVIRAQAAGTKVGAPLDPRNPRFAIPAPGAQFCFD